MFAILDTFVKNFTEFIKTDAKKPFRVKRYNLRQSVCGRSTHVVRRADYLGSLSFIVYYKLHIKPTSENSVRIFVSLSAGENANFQVGKLLKGR